MVTEYPSAPFQQVVCCDSAISGGKQDYFYSTIAGNGAVDPFANNSP